MNNATISVVIPLHNKRRYIKLSVESVLRQQHAALELVVVDDGSTDGSADELVAISDPRMRIVRQNNAGVAHARNRGIAETRHRWIALLDADDLWRPDHLSEIAKMIGACPDAGMLATTIKQVWTTTLPAVVNKEAHASRSIDYFTEAARRVHVVTSSSVAVRRDALAAIGGFRDYRPGEDIDCWVRLALDWPVVRSTRTTAFYMRSTGGQMDDWAAPKIGEKIWPICAIEDFGGTVQTLSEALAEGRYEHRRKSIERYMDARILSNARKCLTWGDTAGTLQRLHFVHDKRTPEYLLYRVMASLPGGVIPQGIGLFRAIRNRLRR